MAEKHTAPMTVIRDENVMQSHLVRWFDELGIPDIPLVGGKNASLGEMTQELTEAGVKVPGGFATTAQAYRDFISANGLEQEISSLLNNLDHHDVAELRKNAGKVRASIRNASLPAELTDAVKEAYARMATVEDPQPAVAVRSSATAEDLPDASFAGQQETFLNVRGDEQVLKAILNAYASLFTDRAVVYRHEHGFDHLQVALSAGVQRMVRSDLGGAGVAFTIDTESGFDQVVFITAAYGLGETVVQGIVDPDEYYLHKPALEAGRYAVLNRELGNKAQKLVYADGQQTGQSTVLVEVDAEQRHQFVLQADELQLLGRQTVLIEKHYGRPMDIEWGKDGQDGQIYILQARPETVHSRADHKVIVRYQMSEKTTPAVTGHAVGRKIGGGRARIINNTRELANLQDGEVLVAEMTDPDWGPVMKRAAAVVTDHGGRACHAAIVARELGIPAVVGCGDATRRVHGGENVTVSCAEGERGYVYPGLKDFAVNTVHVEQIPDIPVRLMMNLANPYQAFELSRLPNRGVGLARTEFIINRMIGIHPRAALEYENLPVDVQGQVRIKIAGYTDPVDYYVDRLASGISMLAAAFHPAPVIVRTSDFKSNEYAHLLGGEQYEPAEENPMLGYRGAARYISDDFRACFELECQALKRVRDDMGLNNVEVMIPFLRTLDEARQVTEILANNGLKRGDDGLRLIMMCEIPSNVLLADQFLEYFDGFSIGSNDLTQLTLGVDRDSDLLAHLFDERDPAVKQLMSQAIQACRNRNAYIGICGQAPSDHPDLARWLMDQGIDSLSLNPDSVIDTWLELGGNKP